MASRLSSVQPVATGRGDVYATLKDGDMGTYMGGKLRMDMAQRGIADAGSPSSVPYLTSASLGVKEQPQTPKAEPKPEPRAPAPLRVSSVVPSVASAPKAKAEPGLGVWVAILAVAVAALALVLARR